MPTETKPRAMLRIQAELIGLEEVARSTLLLRMQAPDLVERALPGQFVMLGPMDVASSDPFLNRPFSIHRCTDQGILELLVAVVGRGTRALERMKIGQRIWVLGPQGRGFRIPADAHTPVLVAGGLGVAPLFFLAEKLLGSGRAPILIYGAASRDWLVPTKVLTDLGLEVMLATDDGSAGFCGNASQVLASTLDGLPASKLVGVYLAACGPHAMLRALWDQARQRRLPLEVSLESRMACGAGACLGCTVFLADDRGARVCCDGPVFDSLEVFGR